MLIKFSFVLLPYLKKGLHFSVMLVSVDHLFEICLFLLIATIYFLSSWLYIYIYSYFYPDVFLTPPWFHIFFLGVHMNRWWPQSDKGIQNKESRAVSVHSPTGWRPLLWTAVSQGPLHSGPLVGVATLRSFVKTCGGQKTVSAPEFRGSGLLISLSKGWLDTHIVLSSDDTFSFFFNMDGLRIFQIF